MSGSLYSAEVGRRFRCLPFAGPLPDAPGSLIVATAGQREQGAVVELAARIDRGRIVDARFRAYGCPHLIAAASWTCERVQGLSVADLSGWEWSEAAAALEVPPAKYGRLLVLQDAVRKLARAAGSEAGSPV